MFDAISLYALITVAFMIGLAILIYWLMGRHFRNHYHASCRPHLSHNETESALVIATVGSIGTTGVIGIAITAIYGIV